MHKTTRSAEKMLAAVLKRLSDLVAQGDVSKSGLSEFHPLVRFFQAASPTIQDYMALDDIILWSALSQMRIADDKGVADLAARLVDRRLFKCIDVGSLAKPLERNAVFRFRHKLKQSGLLDSGISILEDTAKLTPYGIYDYDDKGALQMVLVARRGQGKPDDLAASSPMVKAIETEQICRIYVADAETNKNVESLWRESIQ